jgi:hypothetical protein
MAFKTQEEIKAADEKLKAAAFEFDSKDTMEGFEDINGNTMSVPFVRILQKLSAQLDKQKPEYIPGAEEGQYFNTVTKTVYGNKLEVIVLKFERVYIEWKPNRGGFVGYHTPDNAQRIAVDQTFGKWKNKDGNDLQENYVYLVLIAGHEAEGPVVLSLASSAIKVAREWNRLLTTHVMDNGQKAKPYYLIWNLTSDYVKKDQNTWYTPNAKFSRYIDESQYAITKTERIALPAKHIDYAQLEAKSEESVDTEF